MPFANGSFDVVVCQFGAMFFPDKSKAFAEARRVLRPGGTFIFNVWDRIEENEIVFTVTQVLDFLFPDNPPRFMHRGPQGYADTGTITQDLVRGGFGAPKIVTLTQRAARRRRAMLSSATARDRLCAPRSRRTAQLRSARRSKWQWQP